EAEGADGEAGAALARAPDPGIWRGGVAGVVGVQGHRTAAGVGGQDRTGPERAPEPVLFIPIVPESSRYLHLPYIDSRMPIRGRPGVYLPRPVSTRSGPRRPSARPSGENQSRGTTLDR